MMKKILLTIALIIGLIPCGASADKPKQIQIFQKWSAYKANQYKSCVFYVISHPIKQVGNYKKRGATYIIVAHRPNIASYGVVSIEAGFRYKPNGKVHVSIDNKQTFSLYPHDETAWCADGADSTLIDAMKRGREMTVTSYSSRGTKVVDKYSLMGFGSAYRATTSLAKKKKK